MHQSLIQCITSRQRHVYNSIKNDEMPFPILISNPYFLVLLKRFEDEINRSANFDIPIIHAQAIESRTPRFDTQMFRPFDSR